MIFSGGRKVTFLVTNTIQSGSRYTQFTNLKKVNLAVFFLVSTTKMVENKFDMTPGKIR